MLCKKKKKSSYTKNLFGCERTGDVGKGQVTLEKKYLHTV